MEIKESISSCLVIFQYNTHFILFYQFFNTFHILSFVRLQCGRNFFQDQFLGRLVFLCFTLVENCTNFVSFLVLECLFIASVTFFMSLCLPTNFIKSFMQIRWAAQLSHWPSFRPPTLYFVLVSSKTGEPISWCRGVESDDPCRSNYREVDWRS